MFATNSMEDAIYRFEVGMSLIAPGLIDAGSVEENALFEDRSVVRYRLLRPHGIGEIIEKIEENDRLIMLYYYIQCMHAQVGRNCSFYSDNKHGSMYRLDFYTERDGMCHFLTAIFFTSLEYMYQDIIQAHGRIQLLGHLEYIRPERKVIADFM